MNGNRCYFENHMIASQTKQSCQKNQIVRQGDRKKQANGCLERRERRRWCWGSARHAAAQPASHAADRPYRRTAQTWAERRRRRAQEADVGVRTRRSRRAANGQTAARPFAPLCRHRHRARRHQSVSQIRWLTHTKPKIIITLFRRHDHYDARENDVYKEQQCSWCVCVTFETYCHCRILAYRSVDPRRWASSKDSTLSRS